MEKIHHTKDIERFNPSLETGLDETAIRYMQEHGQINKTKNPNPRCLKGGVSYVVSKT